MMVGWVEPALVDAPRWVLVFGIYFFALILSELLSNNAVAALMTPVTLAIAAELGVDARPLVIALMIGASACFATPIGYQRSEEHTSELQSLMRISYAVFCLKKKKYYTETVRYDHAGNKHNH